MMILNLARHKIARSQIELSNWLIHYLEIANILDDSHNLMLMFEADSIYRFVAENRIREHFIYD